MTMHLEGPWLSTAGKKKGKVKFRNADEARKARELDQSWKELQKKWEVTEAETKRNRAMKAETLSYTLTPPPGRQTSNHIPSRSTGEGVAALKATPEYTGTEMIGISIIHKSCLQPVFNEQSAKDAANMRR